jgi:hypothetical protein
MKKQIVFAAKRPSPFASASPISSPSSRIHHPQSSLLPVLINTVALARYPRCHSISPTVSTVSSHPTNHSHFLTSGPFSLPSLLQVLDFTHFTTKFMTTANFCRPFSGNAHCMGSHGWKSSNQGTTEHPRESRIEFSERSFGIMIWHWRLWINAIYSGMELLSSGQCRKDRSFALRKRIAQFAGSNPGHRAATLTRNKQ